MHAGHAPSISKKRLLVIIGMGALGVAVVAMVAYAVAGWLSARQLGVVAAIVGVIWLIASRFASSDPMRAGQRRYLRQFFPAMLAYFVLVFAFKWLLGVVDQPLLRGLIALLPVLPIVFVVRALVCKLLDGDELERRMQLEAVSIASMSVGLLSFAAAFLEVAGVFHLDGALMLVLPALFLAYGLALFWVRRRYQGP